MNRSPYLSVPALLAVTTMLAISSLAGAQTAPTNFNLIFQEATQSEIDGVPGYGANFGAGNTYDLRFGQDNDGNPVQTPIIESFEVGPDLFIQVPRPVPTPYDRVIVNRRVTPSVDNLNKFTGFFSNNGLAGGVADGAEVFFQSTFIGSIEEIINSYDIDRGADNVFANAASVATRNNVQRIDMIIDDPLLVGAGALARTGILLLERGGNDQLTFAAITSLDPDTGEVTGLGPLVQTSGPLGNTWGSTGVNRATTVFQNANAQTGFQDIRPDQNLSPQAISGSFISLADLGIAAGQPMFGLALFGNDVDDTMDLIGLTDVPLDTDGTGDGGLDLMGGGGFFFSSQLELDKQADVATYANVGDEIQYSFVLSNNGAVTLTNVQVNDPMLGGLVPCSPSTLLPGEAANCGPVTYVVTQADIDAGQITNVAQGSGLDPDDEPLFALDSAIVTGPAQEPGLEVEKLLTDSPDPIFAGDLLEFTISATNTGNITLTDVVVTDPLLDPDSITCPTLAPGDSCVLIGTYEVNQADINAGEFINLASAEAPDPTDPGGPPLTDDDEVTTPLPAVPDIVLDKVISAGSPFSQVNDQIDYSLTATNTGNVPLENVIINDPDIASLSCVPAQPATLAPGETLVCTGSYNVDQDDIDAGFFTNVGTVDGSGPAGQPVSDTDDATADGPAAAPGIEVAKELTDAPDPIVDGSVLTYTVTATNTGNVTLTDVVVSDDLIDPSSITCPSVAPGDTCVLTGTYTVDQDDIDAGQIVNTGSVEAPDPTDPGGPPLTDDDDVTTPINQGPAIELVKELTDAPTPIVDGSVLTYTVTATNTGNVTLTNVVVTDNLIDPSSITCPSVAPGDTCILTGTYTVDQDDIDAGQIVNIGAVEAPDPTDPGGPPLSDDDEVTTPINQGPAIELVKELTDAPTPIVDGSVLTYTVTATNTGNVTLTDVVVSDDLIDPSTITCPSVAPGDTCVLTGTYTVDQDDIDAGQIVNTGSVEAPDPTDPGGAPLSDDDEVTTPVDQAPGIELVKTITDGNPFANVGDLIEYELTATNTGDVTLFNVNIADPGATINSCTPDQPLDLAPGESLTCLASYEVMQSDINAGSYSNTATVTAVDPNDEPVSDSDTAVADGPAGSPGLSLVKVLDEPASDIVAGTVLTYTITATNTGNVTLTDVLVEDDLITPDSILCPVLEVGESCVLIGTYTVQPADMGVGTLVNIAFANGTDPNDNPVPEVTDSVTTLLREPIAVPVGDRWALLLMILLLLATGLATGSFSTRSREI